MRVTVLAGGPSSEREISLESGAAVADACVRLGHDVFKADVMPNDTAALDRPCDIVFPVLHGPFGEDGTLQALLEERTLRYVGSDSAASRRCMDKHLSKQCWNDVGLPTAPWVMVSASDASAAEAVQPPVVVKPTGEGSSVGVVLADTMEDVRRAVEHALMRFDRILVEKRLTGREVTVGILGDRVLPIVEVRPAKGFYDFEAKYRRNDTEYIVEPDLDQTTVRQLQALALRAYRVLGCRHYGRVDLILDASAGPQLLEINTVPGFTQHSLLPKAAARVGIGFDALVGTLLALGMSDANA
ncbi:MAG TPA: D-alanine--D-alanine ligase [Planctomycetaceae bacterium]|nr:D-alanine--D-alanine ligase [Planctomycetaceae bacterium]